MEDFLFRYDFSVMGGVTTMEPLLDKFFSVVYQQILSDYGTNQYEVTTFVLVTCFVAAMRGLLFGYDVSITGEITSMEPFLVKFFQVVHQQMLDDSGTNQYCKLDNQLLTLFTSCLYLVAIIAYFFCCHNLKIVWTQAIQFLRGLFFLIRAFAYVETGGRQYEGEVTAFVLITCFVAAMGGLLFGYDVDITGRITSMEPFLIKFFSIMYQQMLNDYGTNQYCKFDNQLLTLFTSSVSRGNNSLFFCYHNLNIVWTQAVQVFAWHILKNC
ncbi:hypothetical protein HN51_033560 [Arachis hypogaea]